MTLTEKFNSLITSGNWKALNDDDKLQKPKSKLSFVKHFEDNDCVLNHIYINSNRTLYEEIESEAKMNYRAGFIYLNINPEIRGTMFEDESIVKFGKLFDEYYSYLVEDFCNSILNIYNKSYILELFEKAKTDK